MFDKIKSDLTTAMKERDKFKLDVIRMLKTALKMQIRGLFMSGTLGSFRYLYITRGSVTSIAIKPMMKNRNPISSIP